MHLSINNCHLSPLDAIFIFNSSTFMFRLDERWLSGIITKNPLVWWRKQLYEYFTFEAEHNRSSNYTAMTNWQVNSTQWLYNLSWPLLIRIVWTKFVSLHGVAVRLPPFSIKTEIFSLFNIHDFNWIPCRIEHSFFDHLIAMICLKYSWIEEYVDILNGLQKSGFNQNLLIYLFIGIMNLFCQH